MNTRILLLFSMPAMMLTTEVANATLLGRDLNSDGTNDAYYDTELNVTWLADMSYSYVDGYARRVDWRGDNGQYGMDGYNGFEWAAQLNYFGFTGWRLPRVSADPSHCLLSPADSRYCGFAIGTDGSVVYSELISLLYETLGNVRGSDPWIPPQSLDLGPFTNSGGEFNGFYMGPIDPLLGNVWELTPGGYQFDSTPQLRRQAWAVHDGDVHLPEPGTLALFVVGLAGIGMSRRRSTVVA